MNKDVPYDENSTSIEIIEPTEPSGNILKPYDDSMVHLTDNEDSMHDDYDDKTENNKEFNNKKNKTGRKVLFGGPSEEIFLAFAHALRAFSDKIVCLLNHKNVSCVLTGRNNNDPIEHCFSLNRYLAWHHLDLDVSTFAHNE